MAQKVQVILVDDLDGGPADDTVLFGLDGVGYEIDLSGDNAARLRSALSQYVEVARRTGTRLPRGRSGGQSRARSNSDAGAIREWAKQNGVAVSERGRISAEVRAAYARSH